MDMTIDLPQKTPDCLFDIISSSFFSTLENEDKLLTACTFTKEAWLGSCSEAKSI